MTNAENKGGRLDALTAIRGFAALLVVCYHVGLATLSNVPILGAMAAKGYSAVGLFYVLSGFVLTYTYADRTTNYKAFLLARFARVYPVYFLALVLSTPRLLIHLHSDHPGAATAISAVISAPLLLQAWFPNAALEWNGPGWSLSVEAFFYALFPFLLNRLARFGKSWLTALLLTMLVASILPSLLYVGSLHQSWATLTHPASDLWATPQLGILGVLNFNPIVRLPEFVCGIICGLLFLRRTRINRSSNYARWLSLATITATISLMAVPDLAPYPVLHNGGFLPLWCLLVYTLASSGLVAKSWNFSLLVLLGEISYGMYILQQPISNYFKLVLFKIAHINPKGDYGSLSLFLLYIGLLMIVSYLSFTRLETPVRIWIRRLGAGYTRPKSLSVFDLAS